MTTDSYASPDLSCDIVMKGGITSGVVYPGAVLALAERYRFRSIGGASAGGIAASVVAAAEHGRTDGGFDRLAELPGELSGSGAEGQPFMLQLFQPDAATRPLFTVLISCLRHGKKGALRVVSAFWRFPLLAFGVAALAVVLNLGFGLAAVWSALLVFGAIAILVAGSLRDLVRAVLRLPANDFGLCRLGPQAGTEQRPALTGWLHKRIQATAGRDPDDPPLTFADLWAGPDEVLPSPEHGAARLDRVIALSRDPEARSVDLQVMTTNLTHGRPMRLPVPYQANTATLEERGGLLFDPDELRRFFPEDVVDHLLRCAPPTSETTAAHLERLDAKALRHFPIGPDLPVVVATRMTLSFPILIAAIPLYELDFRQEVPGLVRVLFSDGGITSNFPVHFFDSPLASRPTFALNLSGFEPGESPDPYDPAASVREPDRVNKPAYQAVAHIDSLPGFLAAIKDAMQNWRDNSQAQLPGFRDRVIHLKLAKGEGGLNLTMDPAKIAELNSRGTHAGQRLAARFTGEVEDDPEHWNDHRFVRYRTTMSLIERVLRDFARGYSDPTDIVTISYPERVAQGDKPPYAFTRGDLAFAQTTTQAYLDLVDQWTASEETLDGKGVPRPPSTMRAVPPV